MTIPGSSCLPATTTIPTWVVSHSNHPRAGCNPWQQSLGSAKSHGNTLCRYPMAIRLELVVSHGNQTLGTTCNPQLTRSQTSACIPWEAPWEQPCPSQLPSPLPSRSPSSPPHSQPLSLPRTTHFQPHLPSPHPTPCPTLSHPALCLLPAQGLPGERGLPGPTGKPGPKVGGSLPMGSPLSPTSPSPCCAQGSLAVGAGSGSDVGQWGGWGSLLLPSACFCLPREILAMTGPPAQWERR